jgi:hypothetical protein
MEPQHLSWEAQVAGSLSPRQYPELIRRGRPARYLAAIAAIGMLATMALAAYNLGQLWPSFRSWWQTLPDFSISSGVLTWDAPQPWERAFPAGRLTVVVDTSAHPDTAALLARAGNVVLAGRSVIILKTPAGQQKVALPTKGSYTKAGLLSQAQSLYHQLIVLSVGLLVVMTFADAWLRATVVAALLMALAGFGRRAADWRSCWAVAAYAWTLPMLFGPFLVRLGFPDVLLWLAAGTFGVLALPHVFAQRPPSEPPAGGPQG